MESKSILLSKTLWINLIAIAALVIQHFTGYALPPEYQVQALAAINIVLRLVTKQPVSLT